MSNKRQGKQWEREGVAMLAEALGLIAFNNKNHNEAEIGTSGQFSRNLDAEGIDVWFKGIRPIDAQFKSLTLRKETVEIPVAPLEDLGEQGVLFTKIYKKRKVKRKVVGRYVTLRPELFMKLLKAYYAELIKQERESGNTG